MDWAVWDPLYDQGFSVLSRSARISSPKGHPWQCGLWFDHDVIEETALNEASCIEVLKLLVTTASSEVLELEEVLINLQGQLACIDDSWSRILSAALGEKIDRLDTSIQILKNSDAVDDNEFGVALSHGEPAQTICEIVKPFYENYLNQNDRKVGNSVIKSSSWEHTASAASLTNLKERRSMLELSRHRRAEGSEYDYSMPDKCRTQTSLSELPFRNHVEPANKVVLKENVLSEVKSESMNIAETPKAIEGVVLKEDLKYVKSECIDVAEITKLEWTIIKGSSSADSLLATDGSVEDEFLCTSDGNTGLQRHNPSASDERSERLGSSPKPAQKKRKLCQTSNKVKIEKKGPIPRKRKNVNAGLVDCELNEADSLLKWLKHSRDPITKKQVEQEHHMVKREHQKKQKSESKTFMQIKKDSVSMFTCKSQFSSSSSIQVSKSTDLQNQSLTKSVSVDDPSNGNPKLISSPTISGKPNLLDLDNLLLVDLRAIAKQRNMKGYSKLKKEKLAEEIRMNLMVGDACI